MKKVFVLLFIVCSASFLHAQEIVNYFEVASNIATPVKVKTNLGTYYFYGGESIQGQITSLTAYDANGYMIVQNSYYKSEWNSNHTYHYRYYRFESIYNSTSSSDSDAEHDSPSNRNLDGLSDVMVKASHIKVRGIPNLQVRGGWAAQYGEFIALKGEVAGTASIGINCGIGKNFFEKTDSYTNTEKSNSLFAELFLSVNLNNNGYNSFVLGLHYGSSCYSENFFGVQFEYSHFFENAPRLGYFIDGFFGEGISSDDFFFNIGAGISWKLFVNLQREEANRSIGLLN